MNAPPLIPVFASKFARGWPEHTEARDQDAALYLPLGAALLRAYESDVHFAVYSAPAIKRRLAAQDAVFRELPGGVPMVAFVGDVDRPDDADPEAWWHAEREKLERLRAAHPDPFVYRTKGGYRFVYQLARPFTIASVSDSAQWSASYRRWLDMIGERFEIVADRACSDWTRLYRAPNVVRDKQRQTWETLGDARAIGTWDEELAPAPAPPTPRPRTSYVPGPGTFDIDAFMSSVAPGARQYEQRGRRCWDVQCPNEAQHSDKGKRDSVVTFGADGPTFHCFHDHCTELHWRDFRRHHDPSWVPFDERPPWAPSYEPPRPSDLESDDAPDESAACGEDEIGAEDSTDDESADAHPNAPGAPGPAPAKAKPSIATRLVKIARTRAELWRTPGGDLFATIEADGHHEHLSLTSKAFRLWLGHLALTMMGRSVSAGTLAEATGTLESVARYQGAEHPTFVRIAEVGGRIYVDLCDPQWRAVEIDRDGWRVVARPPVRFERRLAMAPLPVPVHGGGVDELRRHVRIADDSWPLVLGWLVGALLPGGPYPLLLLRGPHGSSKSSTARRARSLIDPSIAPIRSEPKEPRDLVITARASHVTAYDNISAISPWLSDGLCRLATGGGYAARALYTDTEEIVFDVKRPVILTGITDVVTAPDLLDRCLLVDLEAIPMEDRETERTLDARWEAARPGILGALYDAVSMALRRRDALHLARKPRLADWAQWATAAEPALGLPDGAVIAALDGQAEEATEIALDASSVARPLCEWIAARIDPVWIGTASDLLAELNRRVEFGTTRDKAWPQSGKGMSSALARIAPALKASGVCVERLRRSHGGVRGWQITRANEVQP